MRTKPSSERDKFKAELAVLRGVFEERDRLAEGFKFQQGLIRAAVESSFEDHDRADHAAAAAGDEKKP